jgi:low temperature requirement protein LtrA
MGKFQFWQKPHDANQIIGHENRKVSWLELFFDIFFVCAIAAVGHILVKDMSWHGFFDFVLTFIPVWWIWIGFTFYNERFETHGFENRFFTFLMMIPVAGLAIFAHHATDESFIGFALSYVVARSILGFLYGRAAYNIKDFRLSGYIYAFCFFLSIVVILLAVFFAPHPLRIYIFGVALTFDLLIPFIATIFDGTFRNPEPLNISDKINERFGLFCIIVIGELVVSVINGISELNHPGMSDLLLGIAGLAVGFGMWWVYFDFVARRGTDKSAIKAYIWSYLHMPLVMSFIGLSAGVLYVIEHTGHITDNARLLIGFCAGFTLILTGLIEWVSYRQDDEPMDHIKSSGLKFVTGIILILVGKHAHIHTTPLMLIVFGMLAINMIYGLWTWFHMPEDTSYESDYVG